MRRSLSLLLYLTPDDWDPVADGGHLRIHHPRGGGIDVPPMPGSLVIFDSASAVHEVLVTRRERTVIAGWLHEEARPPQTLP